MSRLHVPHLRFALPCLLFASALAACSHGGGSPSVTATLSPAPGASTSNLALAGVAYIPDAGNSTNHGIAMIHMVDTSGNLVTPNPMSTPAVAVFPAAVGPLAISIDGTVALSADAMPGSSTPPFDELQNIFGANNALLLPVFTPYNTTVIPTAAPSTTPTPTPSVSPILPDVRSVGILESDGVPTSAVALAVGDGGILGINALAYPPLNFAQFVTYNDPSYTPTPPPPAGPRDNIFITPDSTEALVRGPSDLISFSIAPSASGYTLNAVAHDETLGTNNVVLRGHGAMVVDPASDNFALVAQTTTNANTVTMLKGLPSALTIVAAIPVVNPRSIAWEQSGTYAVVGADGGYYIFTMNTTSSPGLTMTPNNLVTPPPFVGCDGTMHKLTSVTSVAFYGATLVLYGPTDATCTSGADGAVEAFPFPVPSATPTPTPAPSTTPVNSLFVQNNVVAPNASQAYPDYMLVR